MERTTDLCYSNWSSRTSSDTVSFTFTYHTWHFVMFIIFTITACIFSYSLSISFWTQDFGSSLKIFSFPTGLIPRTLGPFNVFILLNGWLCLHVSRLLVGFRTHLKSMHFHSFIHICKMHLVEIERRRGNAVWLIPILPFTAKYVPDISQTARASGSI